MKKVLNPKLKNEEITTIEDSSTREQPKDNIEENNQNVVELPDKDYEVHEEQIIPNFEYGSSLGIVHSESTLISLTPLGHQLQLSIKFNILSLNNIKLYLENWGM